MNRVRDPRELSKSYIDQREAKRTGRRQPPDRMAKVEKQFRSSFESDIRKEIERRARALDEQKQKDKASTSKKDRSWWQFWNRSKPPTEGWS